ncbi:MAG: hypothetical protein FJ040_05260 [Chloroflexi bacterium]|nr:hypothetical protein [Chloroflexota bacterium]
MIHAPSRLFTNTELHQLIITATDDERYELRLGCTPVTTTDGRHVRHPNYDLIDTIRREAWIHGRLDVYHANVYGIYCMHHDVIMTGNDAIHTHIPDILHHHEALFEPQSGYEDAYRLRAWHSVVDWLGAANFRMPWHDTPRSPAMNQFVIESYMALSSAQRAVVAYLFQQHTTSVLLPLMLAMGRATADMYAHAMLMTTRLPDVGLRRTWDEYRQSYHHFVTGAQSAQAYLWLAT